MATITDISRETGLARTTVSEVLRGKGGYSDTSRRRVQSVAQRLGYRPSYLGRALKSGKSMTVGAIWPLRGVTGDVDIAMAVLEEAQKRGYATYQAETSTDLDLVRSRVRDFADRRVDALLLCCTAQNLERLREDLRELPAVVALSDLEAADFEGDLVVLDRSMAIERAVDHLAASGRRRAVIVLSDLPMQRYKIECFRQRCGAHGMKVDGRSLVDLELYKPQAEATGARRSYPKPTLNPELAGVYRRAYEDHFRDGVDADALLCGTDQGAMAAIGYFEERGLRVPEDVAVIGWNNIPAAALWRPGLASIDRSQDQTIDALHQMLLERRESPEGPARRRTVRMEFVWRESAGGTGEGFGSFPDRRM
jgi:LacI family transcriptional regulator